jgi:hypothetical protein
LRALPEGERNRIHHRGRSGRRRGQLPDTTSDLIPSSLAVEMEVGARADRYQFAIGTPTRRG